MIRHAALILALTASLLFAPSAYGGLTFSDASAALTTAVGDAQVAHSFPFTIDGDKPITITDIKTSCGCTTAIVRGEGQGTRAEQTPGMADQTSAIRHPTFPITYAPGESGNITATFVIGDRTGEQTKHIRVHWREGDGPEQVTTLTMKVTIPEVLRITPRFLYWRPAPGSDPKTAKTVDVVIGDGQTLKITGANSSTDDVATEVKAIEDGKRYTLTVTPTTTDQPIRSVITLTTDIASTTSATAARRNTLRAGSRFARPVATC